MEVVLLFAGLMSVAFASRPQVICTKTGDAKLWRNVTLTCEFQATLDVLQVTWQRTRGKETQNMVTFSEKHGVRIKAPFKKHVSVVSAGLLKSSIKLFKLEKDDEACYKCLFNSHPHGAYTGEVCLDDLGQASRPQVICTKTGDAKLWRNVTLTCEFQATLDVLQVTWQRTRGKETQNMVTFSEKYGVSITAPFKKHVSVVSAGSLKSSIKLFKLEKDDEACYKCLFNAHPHGAYTGEVCLDDLGQAPTNEVLCTARGRSDLRISLNPSDIRTRQSDNLTVIGQYADTTVHPKCVFQLESRTRKKRLVRESPVEDLDEVVFQCSVSGKKEFSITWDRKTEPIGYETTMNKSGDIFTVTSKEIHNMLAFPHSISCSIKDPAPQVADVADSEEGLRITRDDEPENHEVTRQRLLVLGPISLVIVLGVVLVVALTLQRSNKGFIKTSTEAITPRKYDKAENGQLTPRKRKSSKKSDGENNGVKSPNLQYSKDGGEVNESTPTNSSYLKETFNSSIKKRKTPSSEKYKSKRKLDLEDEVPI